MRRVSRFLLGIVTTSIPVVIAACYGMMYEFSQRGKVVDKSSKSGVAGLRVECRSETNTMTDRTYTATDGAFALSAASSSACRTIAVDDDRESGARYASTTAQSDASRDLTIEVTPL
jgi:hypothetical protein